MTYIWQYIKPVITTAALTFVTIGVCQGQVVIDPTVTLNDGIYHYDYTITNNSPTDDLFDVTIHVNPTPDAVQNVVTPAGFKSAFDSGLGFVDFLEDSSNFTTGTPLSGFGFDSKFSPSNGFFEANFLSASTANIVTVSGRTLTPTGAVPEPGSWALLGAAIAASGACFARLRRGRRQSSIKMEQGG